MKKVVLVCAILCMLSCNAFAIKVSVDLTQAEIDILKKFYGDSIENYLKETANSLRELKADEKWQEKTITEKEALIP